MSATEHTPAWSDLRWDGNFTVTYETDDGASGFRVIPELGRLIAAAPDLLDALEWILPPPDDCDRCRRSGGCIGHAAIAKARGQ